MVYRGKTTEMQLTKGTHTTSDFKLISFESFLPLLLAFKASVVYCVSDIYPNKSGVHKHFCCLLSWRNLSDLSIYNIIVQTRPDKLA